MWRAFEDANEGRGFYFGSRQSSVFLRIYEEAAEQGVEGHHIGVEAEIKDKRAVVALAELVNGAGPGFVFGLPRENTIEFYFV